MKFCVFGVTGLVGSEILKVLEKSELPVSKLIPVASKRSIGKPIRFRNKEYFVIGVEEAVLSQPDIAIFSAGSGPSLEFAPVFSEGGTTVIDNSSAWRMDPGKCLIVPEINASVLTRDDKIIANPNCSTIQMVLALAPLHRQYQIKRIVVSTYQAVTGTGIKAVKQLQNERHGISGEMAYAHRIDLNAIPAIDILLENGYSKEEMKMVNETRKILDAPNLSITATCVRIPVLGGHSESVNVEFERDFSIDDARRILSNTAGVIVKDEPGSNKYPMPVDVQGKDDVFVGRIRLDESQPRTINMWIVADNLRKGAATNAVQIAEYIFKNKLI